MERSKGFIGISREIISNARLMLDAQVELKENQISNAPLLLGVTQKP